MFLFLQGTPSYHRGTRLIDSIVQIRFGCSVSICINVRNPNRTMTKVAVGLHPWLLGDRLSWLKVHSESLMPSYLVVADRADQYVIRVNEGHREGGARGHYRRDS